MLYVLLPVYNEERDIAPLLCRIHDAVDALQLDCRVLIVNDGSSDGSLAAIRGCAAEINVEVLDHRVNKGLGQAMLTGLSRAQELMSDGDVLVTMDADNTHEPRLIGAMLAAVQAGADVVIASRYEAGGEEVGLTRFRQTLSRTASFLLKTFFPMPGVKDYTCGFRAYRGAMLHRAFAVYGSGLVEEHGFTCMAEILIKMRSLSACVKEVPLILRYDLKGGPSKIKIFRTIMRYFVLISRNLGKGHPAIPEVRAHL